ncbi:hypothetical protein BT96DRAFT_822535 [Gymnopus androsaceus JB14]|uniref:Uncharacterized protein n=1 Tax=Gymnopus androsaceus JB14 TaxID=1447944 RepID=A0A6A4HKT1_9AGAR|nr:hypothetical protein BT96DRAFT_822535 [Gymnopus androsaceus JB14]
MTAKSLPSEGCQLAEIVQYSCELDVSQASPVISCVPLSRLFRMQVGISCTFNPLTCFDFRCPGFPAVELTKVLNVDENGGVETPTNMHQPSGKAWRKIVLHDQASGSSKP